MPSFPSDAVLAARARRRARNRDRQRRLRAQQRAGRIRLSIVVNEDALAKALIASDRVTEAQSGDRRQIEAAVGEVVVDFIARFCSRATD
jgi:hypothetical protein